jgi:hypothetical protein
MEAREVAIVLYGVLNFRVGRFPSSDGRTLYPSRRPTVHYLAIPSQVRLLSEIPAATGRVALFACR